MDAPADPIGDRRLCPLLLGYEVYAGFLGGIDGLTPLPEEYWPQEGEPRPLPPITAMTNPADRKLQQSFGEACPELQRTIKLEIKSRGLVLAVDDCNPEPTNARRVLMQPFSIAIFGKGTKPGDYPLIRTVRSNRAYLDLDRPIASIAEIGKAKVLGGELQGDIVIIDNKATIKRDDDLTVHTNGIVYYKEDIHRRRNQVRLRFRGAPHARGWRPRVEIA